MQMMDCYMTCCFDAIVHLHLIEFTDIAELENR